MNIIEMHGLQKTLGDFYLDIPEFCVEEGLVTGLVGKNGAGKTTTIKLIMNMLFPDQGDISVFGLNSKNDNCAIKEQLGYVGETMGFLDLASLMSLKNMVKPFYRQWDNGLYQQYLKRFSLNENHLYKNLSKGQQKQFALVLALSHHPRLLLLDEPTANLDPVVRNDMLDIILERMSQEEVSVFYSTHITSDLEKAADHVVFIQQGRIILKQDKDVLEQTHCLVKGRKELVQLGDLSHLINIEQNHLGFSAISIDPEKTKKAFGSYAIYEKASIEDIFIAYHKQWERGEENV